MTGHAPQMHPVRRRAVFHIPGFDPVPPRTYRERYRREAARQAEHSGHSITVTPAKTPGAYGWHVAARIEGEEATTDIEVLHWADIVRASMEGGVLATYGQLLRTAWVYLGSGALFRLMRLRKGPLIAALYPVVMLLLQLAAAALAGIVVVLALLRAGEALGMAGAAGLGLAVIAGLGAGALILRLFRQRDPLLAWYLMHDYAFTASRDGAYPPVQEARMAAFADRIAAALASDFDEVLVVGHSSGAHIAISVLADLLRDGRVPGDRPALSLLTLGQVVPMVSFLPGAARLRGDLAELSRSDRLAWVDVTAPGDGCCFALCDPVAVSGMTAPDKRWPLVLSAAFSKTLSPEAWRALRWRFFERHFQYLNAFDNLPDDPGAYDYFAVTAGPQTLAARFAARRPSASRIERAVNPYAERAA
ncbi:MAG: hypothetical protein HLUCCO18_10390 [Rhodobacteraceae bacterium HLUCCO18]|nr:MAG: hypothetical protein HLUCCO18_10390 [Rhodobacteraceae bacterium HLUCCO18]